MNDINEVRERLAATAEQYAGPLNCQWLAADLRALLADHKRLQADAERFAWLAGTVHDADIPGAVQLYFGPYTGSTLRAAIDAARAGQS